MWLQLPYSRGSLRRLLGCLRSAPYEHDASTSFQHLTALQHSTVIQHSTALRHLTALQHSTALQVTVCAEQTTSNTVPTWTAPHTPRCHPLDVSVNADAVAAHICQHCYGYTEPQASQASDHLQACKPRPNLINTARCSKCFAAASRSSLQQQQHLQHHLYQQYTTGQQARCQPCIHDPIERTGSSSTPARFQVDATCSSTIVPSSHMYGKVDNCSCNKVDSHISSQCNAPLNSRRGHSTTWIKSASHVAWSQCTSLGSSTVTAPPSSLLSGASTFAVASSFITRQQAQMRDPSGTRMFTALSSCIAHQQLKMHGYRAFTTSNEPASFSSTLAPHAGGIADVASSCLAASITELPDAGPASLSARAAILHSAAEALEGLHEFTGLPWWATIPLASWCLRSVLLPFSMWQAKTVRTNYLVYKEAVGLTDKQLGISQPLTDNKANHNSTPDAAENRRRVRVLLSNFALLRTKLGAPHPAWVLINPLIQLPCFVVLGATLRMMGGQGWPGMSTGGLLWFTDLTQVALIAGTMLPSSSLEPTPWLMPMGAWGPVLPLTLLAMTVTSLRLGFGAAGTTQVDVPQDWIGRSMRYLPMLLYGLAGLNTWVALQLPHAALLHWLASASFTLGLQTLLQNPAFRAAFKLPTPSVLRDNLARVVNQRLQQLNEQGGVLGPGRGYAVSTLPDSLLKQVAGERNADILVIIGAQHSAAKRYREALYCLDRALQTDPAHVRAHYARGQVFSLNNRWVDAEACYRQAAELAPAGPEKGQALYCMATALHTQGKLEAAVAAYQQAADMWPSQAVVAFSLANTLTQLGRLQEAQNVVKGALGLHTAKDTESLQGPVIKRREPPGPFMAPLMKLLDQIDRLLHQQQQEQQAQQKLKQQQ